ncbi:hypothetical protein [Brumimicrobium aurantiacum]|uniref:Uncharacterized protein n=1 Tax=Brumimicrobium aurantiacum TaxID=1737063 RepID=A0A3E1EZK5_9FLAO|nr:hypothetical protein [Brumimicrobium aurantiacum]RFC54985.1 hypothetical protein DXU93_03960 [Brumimicrobium aurantiacum]
MNYILTLVFFFQILSIHAQDSLKCNLIPTKQESFPTNDITIENRIEIDSIFSKKFDILRVDLKKIDQQISSKTNFKDYLPILVALIAGLLALFQVKANIISSARIEWTQNLRKIVSQYLSEIMILNYNLRIVLDLGEKGKEQEAKDLYNKQTESFKKVFEYGNQIKLFLNNKKETEHSELQDCIQEYFNKATHGKGSTEIDELETMQEEIIFKSQQILKQSWEDAKTFKIKDIFKFSWK